MPISKNIDKPIHIVTFKFMSAPWNKGKAENLSPIAIKVRNLVDSGKTSYEAISVACDMRYYTLMNLFQRKKHSKMTIKSLLYARIINQTDIDAYHDWAAKLPKKT